MSFTSMLADAASTLSTAVGDVLEEASAEFSASGLSLVTVGGRTVQPRRVLAEGGFSCVYKAVDEGGAAFALKRMVCQDRTTKVRRRTRHPTPTHPSPRHPPSDPQVVAKRELKALRHLAGHKNVVKLLGFTSRQDGGGAVEAYFLFPLYVGTMLPLPLAPSTTAVAARAALLLRPPTATTTSTTPTARLRTNTHPCLSLSLQVRVRDRVRSHVGVA